MAFFQDSFKQKHKQPGPMTCNKVCFSKKVSHASYRYHGQWVFLFFFFFNLSPDAQPCEVIIIKPILQIGNLRLKAQLAQSHKAADCKAHLSLSKACVRLHTSLPLKGCSGFEFPARLQES